MQASFDGTNVRFTFGIPRGAQGQPFAGFQVDNVTTLDPGNTATVRTNFDGSGVHFSFGIPRGNDGAPGSQGGPFTNFVVDAVNTLPPWENATLQVSFDGSAVHFAFGIPRGMDGQQGPPGLQGALGELTALDLAAAIAGTSTNTNGFATLDAAFSDPPTLADPEAVHGKLNELIMALRR